LKPLELEQAHNCPLAFMAWAGFFAPQSQPSPQPGFLNFLAVARTM
jgi:hypothetical protein